MPPVSEDDSNPHRLRGDLGSAPSDPVRILVVSPGSRSVEVLRAALRQLEFDYNLESLFVTTASKAKLVAEAGPVDVVLAAADLPDGGGAELLDVLPPGHKLLLEESKAVAGSEVHLIGPDVAAARQRIESLVAVHRLARLRP